MVPETNYRRGITVARPSIALFAANSLLLALVFVPRLGGEDGQWVWTGTMTVLFLALVAAGSVALTRARPGWMGAVAAATVACGGWYVARESTLAAWALIGGYQVLLMASARVAWARAGAARRLPHLQQAAVWLLAAAAGGGAPVLLMQIESRFSDEEFYVASLVLVMGLLAGTLFSLIVAVPPRSARGGAAGWPFPVMAILIPGLLLVGAARSYQASSYGEVATGYPGITGQSPILCATLPAGSEETTSVESGQVVARILEQTRNNPHREAPEAGLVALLTGDQQWATEFHARLLEDARAGRYSEPAHSVKYYQYEAARSAYFFHHVREAFPGLFSPDEEQVVREWFAAVNRRAMTVEWVDLLYGLAFSEWQPGPYANQEIGSGLIAILTAYDLADPALEEANTRYLAESGGGWRWRWRNSDDTYEYQRVWVDNAFFQAIRQPELRDQEDYHLRQALSFEWLLLQMLPDGRVPSYNNPGGTYAPAPSLLMGAALTGDGRYAWAAGRMEEGNARLGYLAPGQPSLEAVPERLEAEQPREGSCLLFGDSGQPNRRGPLAPDKLVFRDGWARDSQYLLLNLRFTGWHRYKGTNSVSVMAREGEILIDDEPEMRLTSWVPAGRQKFRDKRISRAQMNSLLVPRTGASRVIYTLTGMGGPWAEDPPFYAEVERFTTLPRFDSSRTTLRGWRGWDHSRTVYFLHEGPAFIVDEAVAPGSGGHAAVVWNAQAPVKERGETLWLGESARLSVGDAAGGRHSTRRTGAGNAVLVEGTEAGILQHVSALLPGEWGEGRYAASELRGNAGEFLGYAVVAEAGGAEIRLLHNAQMGRVEHDGLATDGEALLVRRDADTTQVCYVSGSVIQFPATEQPRGLAWDEGSEPLMEAAWSWQEGVVTVEVGSLPGEGCLLVEG
jgi:hypothetical protein